MKGFKAKVENKPNKNEKTMILKDFLNNKDKLKT